MNSREYERMERRRRTQRKSLITTIIAGVIIIAAVVAIIVVVISLIKNNSSSSDPADSTVAATEQPTLYMPTEQGVTPTVPEATVPAQVPATTADDPDRATEPAPIDPGAADYPTEASDPVYTEPADSGSSDTGDDGTLHVYTYGHVDGDYYWSYSIDNVNVKITCKHDYDTDRYDFSIKGVSPGAANVILYYKTATNNKEALSVTVMVNDDLSVTRID